MFLFDNLNLRCTIYMRQDFFSQPSQHNFIAYDLINGNLSGWLFFSWLSWNASNSSLALKISTHKLRPDSPPRIVERIVNSYSTPTPRLLGIWGSLAGLKIRRDFILHLGTLFYVKNCGRQLYLFMNEKLGYCLFDLNEMFDLLHIFTTKKLMKMKNWPPSAHKELNSVWVTEADFSFSSIFW